MKLLGIACTIGLCLMFTVPGSFAADPPNFDFLGHVASVPTQPGGTLQLLSVINNNGVIPTPIPLDFTSTEHTLVIEATLLSQSGNVQLYSPGTVRLYSDSGPATAHDFANPSTFSDGTLILSGSFSGNLTRQLFTTSLGSTVGNISWSGGSRLGELGSNTSGWALGGGLSRGATLPSGYVETWDGKIDQATVAVNTSTWGAMKQLYRP